jgi:hypothetical protein
MMQVWQEAADACRGTPAEIDVTDSALSDEAVSEIDAAEPKVVRT